MGYVVKAECSVEDVLIRFLEEESPKQRNEPNDAADWQNLLQEVKHAPREHIRRMVRDFAESKHNDSPFFPWTVGYRQNEFYKKVVRWVQADVDLTQAYTSGLNPKMKAHLIAAQWNLDSFRTNAHHYQEFHLQDPPPPEALQTVYGIAHNKAGKVGTIELIDGAHRTISMLHHGIKSSKGFIGELIA